MKALNELQLRQISACPGNIELQDWLKILVADNAVLVRSLTVIANSDEHHGKTMVCDFDSLISVATAGLKEHEQLLKGNTSPDCEQQETNIPMFYVDGEAAIRLLKGHTRFAAMTTEPKSGKTLPLYINAQSASVAPAETERKGKRLRVAEGRYAAYFPQERPLDGAQIIAWDENGNLLGIGFGRDTRDTGVAIIVNGKKYDSNHVIHWCS
ncbi:hypothetical protein ABLV51_19375 [Klebsiella sp. GB_Kp051]|uniref:hypothetical protein n=1 Tax=Klebsiella sp. GB_Kp051 TaxID=3153402 RepID=UPI0032B49D4B